MDDDSLKRILLALDQRLKPIQTGSEGEGASGFDLDAWVQSQRKLRESAASSAPNQSTRDSRLGSSGAFSAGDVAWPQSEGAFDGPGGIDVANTNVGGMPVALSVDPQGFRATGTVLDDLYQKLNLYGAMPWRGQTPDVGFRYSRRNPGQGADDGLDIYGRRALRGKDWELGVGFRKEF